MSYSREKLSDKEVQDERPSAEIGLLPKADAEYYYFTEKALKKRSWVVPLLFHTSILAVYTLFFLYALWSLRFGSKCRLPNSIDCENFIHPIESVV